jgi:VWFA-related protein
MRRVTLAAAALLWGLTAQASDSVTIDVVVTDAKLRPIADLSTADFELIESGEVRPLEDAHLAPADGRVLALFLDEFHVGAGDSTARTRAALTHFVKTQLRDADSVAIMKPLDPLHAIEMTTDKQTILDAIAGFNGRRGDYGPRSAFEEKFISRDPATAAVSRAQVVTAALQALAARLGARHQGRKALILISEGFSPAAPRAVALAANRHRVAIYAIDPSVTETADEQALRTLAEQTGGYASVNQADLAPPLDQSIADLDRHYVLTYRAPSADGRFHPVEIRVQRAGLRARARAGYWAASAAPATPPAAARTMLALPFRPAHSSPYIRPWIGMSRGSEGTTRVTLTWEAAAAPPRNQRIASITVKALAADGNVLFQRRFGPGDAGGAAFETKPGYIALEMAIQSSTGAALDTDYRGVSVPDLQVRKPTIATPQVFRARTAREFVELSANAAALPVASRTFSRAERLLVRVPVYGPDDSTPTVTATLLNRRGIPMRQLPSMPGGLPGDITQFDVQLSSLAPDEYRVELVAGHAAGPNAEARELIVFRVTN